MLFRSPLLTDDGFFQDPWKMAREHVNERFSTMNGFKAVTQDGKGIDWILIRGKAEVGREKVITFSRDGKFSSEHCPLMATLRLP